MSQGSMHNNTLYIMQAAPSNVNAECYRQLFNCSHFIAWHQSINRHVTSNSCGSHFDRITLRYVCAGYSMLVKVQCMPCMCYIQWLRRAAQLWLCHRCSSISQPSQASLMSSRLGFKGIELLAPELHPTCSGQRCIYTYLQLRSLLQRYLCWDNTFLLVHSVIARLSRPISWPETTIASPSVT